MDMASHEEYLKFLLRNYYEKAELILPDDLYVREIALQPLDSETYIRHLSFLSIHELRSFITKKIPRHLYYSSARYQEPANPLMDGKKWMGSDLIFDIDANDLLQCKENENIVQFKFCKNCGYISFNLDEKICPNCNSMLTKFEHIDPYCIELSKDYVRKLMDIIEKDFAFNNYEVVFSGHRGFHIIINLPIEYKFMTAEERREIISYIRIEENDIKAIINELLNYDKTKHYISLPPQLIDGGIRRRIATEIVKKSNNRVINDFIMGLIQNIDYHEVKEFYKDLHNIIYEIVREISIPIDTKVTMDITHLVRVPNSINGKTGWIAHAIKNRDLEGFHLEPGMLSPFNDIKMKIKMLTDIPNIRVIDKSFKCRKGEELVTDAPYATYFIFKELAKIINIKN